MGMGRKRFRSSIATIIVALTVALPVSSCDFSSETPRGTLEPYELWMDLMPLEIGNYWIWDGYPGLDTLRIVRDTVYAGRHYFEVSHTRAGVRPEYFRYEEIGLIHLVFDAPGLSTTTIYRYPHDPEVFDGYSMPGAHIKQVYGNVETEFGDQYAYGYEFTRFTQTLRTVYFAPGIGRVRVDGSPGGGRLIDYFVGDNPYTPSRDS